MPAYRPANAAGRLRRARPGRPSPNPKGARLVLLLAGGVAALIALAATPSCTLDRLGLQSSSDAGVPEAGQLCEGPADCPGLDTSCQSRTCAQGVCGFSHAVAGTLCTEGGGQFCDGQGNCVQCVDDSQCTPLVCRQGQCIPGTCEDGQLNGDETDTDCGGSCLPCTNGQRCSVGDDCQSGYCTAAGVCAPCSVHEDCPGGYCDPATGQCAEKKLDGDVCADGAECVSGFCPSQDGLCCAEACAAECMACMQGKTGQNNGVCAVVTAQTDPDTECAAAAPSTCASNGEGCNGVGGSPGCILHPSGTECQASSCSSGSEVFAHECDGNGSCDSQGGQKCDPYVCNGAATACLMDCSAGGASDCMSTDYYCDSSDHCIEKGDLGDFCSAHGRCKSGRCYDSVCCNANCGGPCLRCNGSTPGTCEGESCSCNEQYGSAPSYEYCSEPSGDCEFFTEPWTPNRSCDSICGQFGGECEGVHDNGASNCTQGSSMSCSTSFYNAICICSGGCGSGPRCPPGQSCSNDTCS